MTRYAKTPTGKYKIKGKVYPKLSGSRAQVWHGTAYKTTGDLTKLNLMKRNGRIISSKKHKSAKRDNRLVKHGYGARKGQFGMVRLTKRTRKGKKGGFHNSIMNPASISGIAGDSGDALQLEAGMAGGRRRRKKGGFNRSIMNPAPVSGMADDSMSTDALQLEAGMAGGRRRRRRRRSRKPSRRGGKRSRKRSRKRRR